MALRVSTSPAAWGPADSYSVNRNCLAPNFPSAGLFASSGAGSSPPAASFLPVGGGSPQGIPRIVLDTDTTCPQSSPKDQKIAELEKKVEMLMLGTGLPLLTRAVAIGCEWMLLQSFYRANGVNTVMVTAFRKPRPIKVIDIVLEKLRKEGSGTTADKLSAFAEEKGLGESVRRELRTLRQPGNDAAHPENVSDAAEQLQSLLSTMPAGTDFEEASFTLSLFQELKASL